MARLAMTKSRWLIVALLVANEIRGLLVVAAFVRAFF
jgi:hypothetical protein